MTREGNVEKALVAQLALPESQLLNRVRKHNQIMLHNFRSAVKKSCGCTLMGCLRKFEIVLIPNQVIYPKFCEDHRSEFRREIFLRAFLNSETGVKAAQVLAAPPYPSEDTLPENGLG